MDSSSLSTALLDHVRHHAALIFLIIDRDGIIREANAHAQELMGAVVEKHIADVLLDFDGSFQLHTVLAETDATHLINIPTRSGLPQTFYFRFVDIGPAIMVVGEVNSAEIEDLRVRLLDTNNRINTLMRELHKKNAELGRAREKAEAANRAKSNFLASMSHEIRTPLNAVIGIGRLLKETQLDAKQQDFLGNLVEAADSLLGIINDILDFSRIEADRLELAAEPFVVSHLFQGVVGPLGFLARKKGLALSLTIAPDIPPLLVGDSVRFRQIVTNLVGNAIKFTQSGEVCVTAAGAAVADENPDAGNLPLWRLVFSVRDSGIGIPPEKQHHIFESFTQADASTTRRFGGTGLGLAIAQRLVVKMGGEISLESTVGVGSCFTVRVPLPIVAMSGSETPAVASLAAPAAIRPLTILLADDIELNRRFMVEMLTRRGHTVDAVNNGRMILEALPSRNYDLVLTDIAMPDMDGIEATRLIRASIGQGFDPEIPVIAISASTLAESRAQIHDAGINGFVGKPIDFAELFRVIGQVVPGSVAGAPEVTPPISARNQPPEVTVLDIEYLSHHFQGAQELMNELLTIFLAELPEKLAVIEAGLAAGNCDQVERVTHSLKGTAATVGAKALAKISTELCSSAHAADLVAMSGCLDSLRSEVKRLQQALATMLRP